MKENFSDYNINTGSKYAGTIKTNCPQCPKIMPYAHSASVRSKDLSVNITEGLWNCHRCGWSGSLREKRIERIDKAYKKPVWNNKTNLSEKLVKWFEGRKISQNTLKLMKITEGLEYMPQANKEMNTTQFNYFRDDVLTNVKFRDALKNFKLVSGAELIFYNLDAIKTSEDAIVVEGEIDCLSYFEANLQYCVSVPNGANKNNNNLEYIDNCYDYFENKKRIYIATDNDTAGLKLRKDLIIRFGAEKCYIIDFKDVKDANEYLVKYGVNALRDTLKYAKECKIDGVLNVVDFEESVDDLFINGLQRGNVVGLANFDEICSWVTGCVAIVTGIPTHGKSEFIDELIVRLNCRYGWRAAYFSPENYPLQIHVAKLISKIVGKTFSKDFMTDDEYMDAKVFMNDNFDFIYPDNDDFTLENILDKAKFLVRRKGTKILVIDPWNRIEHQLGKGESETNYISKQLDKITMFAQRNDVLVFVVAHPRKMEKVGGIHAVPTLYDVNGSANFYNKAFYGITVYRHFEENPRTEVFLQKIKFKHLGKIGSAEFSYEFNSGRYFPYAGNEQQTDNENFLLSPPDEVMPF